VYNDLLFILYLHTPIVLWIVNNLTCTIQFWSTTFQFLYHSVKILGVDASLSQFPLMIEFAGPCWDRLQRHESNEGQEFEPVRFWFM